MSLKEERKDLRSGEFLELEEKMRELKEKM